MSQDNPDINQILTTVKEFAEGVAKRSSGAERYDALCAAFLMGVVQRELKLGERQDDGQLEQLQSMLGKQGDLAELYQAFSSSVREGHYDNDWQAAFDFAFKQVVDKVKVTNPNHLEVEHRDS
ncbi:MAG: hypothetical protein DRR42_00980 [Gammaproteobacteria bacterium]|nr:MAG: hypothetical protein DRR42_00980 [Gammaproteobacteria bacterium]